jgi:hypothetical protein
MCIAAVVGAALLAAGCGDKKKPSASTPTATATATKPPETPEPPGDAEQMQSLLLERSRALQDGDEERLAATSTGAQQVRDRRAAKSAAALPLSSVEVESTSTNLGKRSATMHALTRYDFDGVESTFAIRSSMSFIKTPDGWRVKRDRPAGIEAPWQRGSYTVRRSEHFVALTPKGLKVSGFMKDLEAGRARMKRALPGVKAPGRLLVVVSRGTADTKALTRDVRALGTLNAIAEASVDESGPARRVTSVAGQRLLVVWRSFGRQDHSGRRRTIAHEMTHASLLTKTSGRMPVWLVEGMAMYTAGDPRYGDAGALLSGGRLRDSSQQAASKRVLSLTALGRPTSMVKLASTPLAFAYSYSAAAAYAIAAKHGRKGLLRLYEGFNSEKIKGRAGRKLMDRVMRKTLHQSLASVQRDVDAFARAHAQIG